jgi:hypothetical protein
MVQKREHEIAAQQLAFEVQKAWEESKEEQQKVIVCLNINIKALNFIFITLFNCG